MNDKNSGQIKNLIKIFFDDQTNVFDYEHIKLFFIKTMKIEFADFFSQYIDEIINLLTETDDTINKGEYTNINEENIDYFTKVINIFIILVQNESKIIIDKDKIKKLAGIIMNIIIKIFNLKEENKSLINTVAISLIKQSIIHIFKELINIDAITVFKYLDNDKDQFIDILIKDSNTRDILYELIKKK